MNIESIDHESNVYNDGEDHENTEETDGQHSHVLTTDVDVKDGKKLDRETVKSKEEIFHAENLLGCLLT